jgi:hypothetical protein
VEGIRREILACPKDRSKCFQLRRKGKVGEGKGGKRAGKEEKKGREGRKGMDEG